MIHGAYSEPCLAAEVKAVLIIIAIVPGPAVEGIASGTKAMPVLTGTVPDTSEREGGGKSIRKPINATINPPAIRSPGMEMPKVFITSCPA